MPFKSRGISSFRTKSKFLYLKVVLQFKQSDTIVNLILTLSEKASIDDPVYLFVFTHVLTKQKVKFLKADDESLYTERYNQFILNPAVVFFNKPTGEYHYKIYEQESYTNTNETLTGAVVESGKLILDRAIPFAYTMYNQPTTYKAYNG